MKLQHVFGQNVRKRRKVLGWSQEQLALEANIQRTYMSELERGIRNPTLKIVEQLARTLQIEPAELLVAPQSEASVSDKVENQV